jgi:hypothetical protein
MSDFDAPGHRAPTPDGGTAGQVKEGVADAAHDVRDEVASSVADVKDQAASQIGHVKDEVVHQASDVVHQAREQVGQQVDDSTHRLADALRAAGQELSAMAQRSEQDGPMTDVVRQLGHRASTMGQRYQQGGRRALTGDVTSFARRSPGMFLLAAAGAGFVVGRIVRNADTKAITDAARHDSAPDTSTVSGQLGARSPELPGGSSVAGPGESPAGVSIGVGAHASDDAAAPLSPSGPGTVR